MNTRKPARSDSEKLALNDIEEGTAFLALTGVQKAAPHKERAVESSALPSPSRLTDHAFAFQRAAALRAAVDLDGFTAIDEGHRCEALLVHAALTPGGWVFALKVMLKDDHVSPPFGATMNFSLLAITPSGRVPTPGELEALFRAAGFQCLECHNLPGYHERVVVGWK